MGNTTVRQPSNALILDPVAQKNGLGTMTPDRWQGLLNQMVAAGLIAKDAVDAQTAFTDRFLP